MMNVLLIGSGGREHALAWAIAESPKKPALFVAPGSPGLDRHATLWAQTDLDDYAKVVEYCREWSIGLVVVGPEAPLAAGLVDVLEDAGICVFGPRKAAAVLETSKRFTKEMCRERNIPTARFEAFDSMEAAQEHIRSLGLPTVSDRPQIVVKADGLAAGKGVAMACGEREALEAAERLGPALVVEEVLAGAESSLFVLCDGEYALPLPPVMDYKALHAGGPNTGGMGAVCPSPAMDGEMVEAAMRRIVTPTLSYMGERGTPFKGLLYAGLMLTAAGPQLVEYNVRFGDPETQALAMMLDEDLFELLLAAAQGGLADHMRHRGPVRCREGAAAVVVLASAGYPAGGVKDGIELPDIKLEAGDLRIFHAGTTMRHGKLVSQGGRVLNAAARGRDLAEARRKAYGVARMVEWEGCQYRPDIGEAA